MTTKSALLMAGVVAVALTASGCQLSPTEVAAGKAYLTKAEHRLANVENAEMQFHQQAFHCDDQPKEKVDQVIGDVVEARVFAKLELKRLQREKEFSVRRLESSLEPALHKVESRFDTLKKLCPSVDG